MGNTKIRVGWHSTCTYSWNGSCPLSLDVFISTTTLGYSVQKKVTRGLTFETATKVNIILKNSLLPTVRVNTQKLW